MSITTSYTFREYTVTYTSGITISTEVQLGVYGTTIAVGAGRRMVTGVPLWTRGFDNRYSMLETGVEVPGVFRFAVNGLDEQANIYGTFQIGFGYHLAPGADRDSTRIARLWANGHLIYDASDPADVRRFAGESAGIKFVLQDGSETQTSEGHVLADKGPSPGNRGMIIATFIGFPSGAIGAGATIPTFVAELVENVTIEPTRTDWTVLDTDLRFNRRPNWLDWNDDRLYGLREDPDNVWEMQSYSVEARTQIDSRPLGGFTATHDGAAINSLAADTVMISERNNKVYMSINGIPNTAPIIELDYRLSQITKVWAESRISLFPTTFQDTPGDGGSIPWPASGTVVHGVSNNGVERSALLTGTAGNGALACLSQIGVGSEGMSFIESWDPGSVQISSISEFPLLDMPDYNTRRGGYLLSPWLPGTWNTPAPGQAWAAIICAGERAFFQYGTFGDDGAPHFHVRHMFAHFPGMMVRFAHVNRQNNDIVLFLQGIVNPFIHKAAKFTVGFETIDAVLATWGGTTSPNYDGDMNPVQFVFTGLRGLIPIISAPPIGSTVRYDWLVDIPAFPNDDHFYNAVKHSNSSDGMFAWTPAGDLATLDLNTGATLLYDLGPVTEIGNFSFWWHGDKSLLHIAGASQDSRSPYDLAVQSSVGGTPLLLSDVLKWLAMRAGYEEDEIDIDASITDTVLGIHMVKSYTVDKLFSDLGAVYDFRYFESGEKIKFTRAGLGGSFTSVATLTRSDLAPISEGSAGENECVTTTYEPDGQAINQVALTYIDPALGYQANVQNYSSPNIVDTAAAGSVSYDIPIVMTNAEAYNRVAQIVLGAIEQSVSQTFRLPWKYLRFEPADGLTLTFNGYTYAVRLDEVTINGDWTLSCLGRNYGFAAATTVDVDDYVGALPQEVPGGNTSRPMMIDGPLLSASFDVPLTAVVYGGLAAIRQTGWTGGYLQVTEAVPVQFENAARAATDVPFGLLGNALGDDPDWGAENTTDSILVIAKSMVEDDLAEAPDEESFLSGVNTVAIGLPGRWEYIYFRHFEVIDPKTFRLYGLLRGRRGTEVNMASHLPTDHVFLLRSEAASTSVTRVTPPAALIGETLVWRGKGDNELPVVGFDITATLTAESLRPWAPCEYHADLQVSPLNDLILTWQRRDRLWDDTWTGDLPMSEAVEKYTVEIYDGDDLVRTVENVLSQSLVYTAAQQTADGFTPPLTQITFRVYQISAVVGRGYATTRTVDVE